MIRYGDDIFRARDDFFTRFIPIFRHYYNFISNDQETVDIAYQSQLSGEPLKDLLAKSLPRDRASQYTNAGIHKDDVEFLLGGFPVKKYGSQGQQKSFVVAIKLAQFDYTRNIKGYKPVLLLDDIFDKLDELRVSKIIELVSENNFGQVFITDTQEMKIKEIFDSISIDHKIFRLPISQD